MMLHESSSAHGCIHLAASILRSCWNARCGACTLRNDFDDDFAARLPKHTKDNRAVGKFCFDPHCSEKGLSDADVAELQAAVNAAVQDNLGMAMIYGLVTAAQEWLADKVSASGNAACSCKPCCKHLAASNCRVLKFVTHVANIRLLQAAQGAEPAPLDPAAARKAAEEAAERRLAEIRSHGTPVTPETFAPWKERFYAELAAARAR